MIKVGQKVRFITENDFNIPFNSHGIVLDICEYKENVKVDFGDRYWTVQMEELLPVRTEVESFKYTTTEPSKPLTLNIPLVNGTESLTGEFQDSEGTFYYVSIARLNQQQKEEV